MGMGFIHQESRFHESDQSMLNASVNNNNGTSNRLNQSHFTPSCFTYRFGAVIPIVKKPAAVLRKPCEALPIEEINSGNRKLQTIIDNMFDTLQATSSGIAIAAPQIGIPLRIIVLPIKGRLMALINPELTPNSGKKLTLESCLSLFGFNMHLKKRARSLRVNAFDRYGSKVTFDLKGLEATCIQHEVDHLNGILICDRQA